MLIGIGLFLATFGLTLSECPISLVDDGCLPIDDVRVFGLIIISCMFVVGGIISLQLAEIVKTKNIK